MSFEQEWAQLRSESLDRQAVGMRLNGTGGGASPTGKEDLRTNRSGKAGAVKALQEDIQPGTKKAGIVADDASDKVVTGLSGWATATGLKDAQEEWDLQVKSLQGRLAGDKDALQQTNRDFVSVDHKTKSSLSQLLPLDRAGEK